MVPHIAVSYWETGGNPRKQALFDRLREWAEVDVLAPDEEHPALPWEEYDLYHMAKRRQASLRDLDRAVEAGVPVLNGPRAARLASDRVARLGRLEAADIPLPTSQYGRAETIDLEPPVVIKPRFEFGDRAHDVRTVAESPIAYEGARLVEQRLDYDRAYKCYVLGPTCRVVDVTDHWTECSTPPAVLELLAGVRSQFALSVFELDVVVEQRTPYLLDLNPAVSLRGVQDGASLYHEFLGDRCAVPRSQAAVARHSSLP